MRDTQRATVYSVEDQVGRSLLRGGVVEFFDSTLVLPAERRFADIDSISAYVQHILDLLASNGKRCLPVQVRERRGATKAHYEAATSARSATIAVPLQLSAGTRWAARETVVLHELTHHVIAGEDATHGPRFCGALIEMYRLALGAEAALLLRSAMAEAGISVDVRGLP
ncbi:MAG: TIGR04338 family metallohydrolase [Actinomycetes bacterium]|jgi:putative metallohydrolase (TIGR04338 family)